MIRIILGIIVGFMIWLIALIGGEVLLSALLPEAFGAHQKAFQEVLTNGGAFTANATHLMMHVVLGAIASLLAGFVAALIAVENKRAPLVLGCLLLALGVLKVVMSWPYVPIWYHVIFTGMLAPLTILGSRLKRGTKVQIEAKEAT